MTKTDKLYKDAREAIGRLFSDTSIEAKQTIEKLEELKDEINELITSVDVNAPNYGGTWTGR